MVEFSPPSFSCLLCHCIYPPTPCCGMNRSFFLPFPTNVHLIIVLNPSSSICTFVSLLNLVDIVGDRMGEHKILDEVGVMGGNKMLDEVGEWGEVDIVEEQIGEERDNVGEGGEGKMGENPMFDGRLTVSGQSRRIQAESPPSPGANELTP